MPLKKLTLKAGVNRENTRYTSENGWYESDKVRFRQGTPEIIGGWTRISANFFLGICRSLWNWATLGGANFLGVGTNLKFYVEFGGIYYDITPVRSTVTLNNPFDTTSGSAIVTVNDVDHGCATGDYVTFSGASTVGGLDLNNEYSVTVIDVDSYTITASANASSTVTGGGGSSVVAAYQIGIGAEYGSPITGWGAGGWGSGGWGVGTPTSSPIRLWQQTNFGENLVFGYRSGPLYYWDNNIGLNSPGVLVSSLGGDVTFTSASPTVVTATTGFSDGTPLKFDASSSMPSGVVAGTTYYVTSSAGLSFKLVDAAGSPVNAGSTGSGVYISQIVDVPLMQNYLTVSDASRFVFAFGTNDYGSILQNPMLLRWSDQESITNWTPSATNQAGSLLLSHGSKIVSALQTRQEIVVLTDSAIYSLQYLGAPAVWGSQLLGDNISIVGPNAAAVASGTVYWMGVDKFYKYDGRVQTLRCDLRQFIYDDINLEQQDQFFASTNEGYNEVWFFYCSANSNSVDRYVVYNYIENNEQGAWYYGTMARSAWLDSGLRSNPMAATYINNIVYHEDGVDDNATEVPTPIYSIIGSAEFDIDDGDHFGFVWRMLPDITFRGSSTENPQVTMTLIPMQNSGSGFNSPTSVAGSDSATIVRTATVPIEKFTGQVYVRVRGRQMILQLESNQLGCAWQLGAPRIDIKQDGRR